MNVHAVLGEGALWDARAGALLWVDILGQRVGRLNPATRTSECWTLDSLVGAVVPAESGGLLLALGGGVAMLDTASGRTGDVACPEGHDPETTRFNDGKCDPAGRFVAGTVSLAGQAGMGSLYVFEHSREGLFARSRRLLSNVSISNGLAWSADHSRMYYIDTPTRAVSVFDYDLGNGVMGNRRVAVEIPERMGLPDGMTIDAEGMLWVALWGGGAVTRWNPRTGKLLCHYALPVTHATSCAFGGPGLRTLFVTTARASLRADELARQPLAGAIFAIKADVPGVAAFYFKNGTM
ncbi:MAG: SMP-30/gluconolactonase/LRE family protein [Opitutaceae bacterium]|nr:SMP-30/gluconolactonase/LRE family protein [Opitutaceae bacterium]